MTKTCFGCLAKFKKTTDTPIPHPYIGAIAECWDVYCDILNKEFSNPAYFKVHRTTVDAYAAQHIGNQDDRRARQSANVHLIALYLTFSQKASHEKVLTFIRNATKIKRDWPPLIQRKTPEWLTVQDIVKADSPSSHAHLVTRWGQSVWEAYADCHQGIINTYKSMNVACP